MFWWRFGPPWPTQVPGVFNAKIFLFLFLINFFHPIKSLIVTVLVSPATLRTVTTVYVQETYHHKTRLV